MIQQMNSTTKQEAVTLSRDEDHSCTLPILVCAFSTEVRLTFYLAQILRGKELAVN